MDVIISKQKDLALPGSFLRVSSVSQVPAPTTKSTIIYCSSDDSVFAILEFFQVAVRTHGVSRAAFLVSDPDPILALPLQSLGVFVNPFGDVDGDDLLRDVDALNDLIGLLASESPSDPNPEALLVSGEVISKHLDASLSNQPPVVARPIRQSLEFVLDYAGRLSGEQSLLSTNILDMVYRVSRDLEDLRVARDQARQSASAVTAGSRVSSFPTYPYGGVASVLLFKEHLPLPFLTSFVGALPTYLSTSHDIKAKVIIVDRPSAGIEHRYRGLPRVDKKSLSSSGASLALASVVWTTQPSQLVMSHLFDAVGFDLFIILDRSGESHPIVSANTFRLINATSSTASMRALGLVSSETMVGDGGEVTQFGSLGVISNYPLDPSTRVSIQIDSFRQIMKACYDLVFG